MQIDKTMLDRLLSLDDVTLSRMISALAAATGIEKSAADAAVNNLRLVRASLSNATDADIEKVVSMLGEDRSAELLKKLGGMK